MSTRGEIGPDVHALKELAVRREEHRSEIHSNESQHLAEGMEVAGTFFPHASLSLQTEGGACGHPTAQFAMPGVCTRALYRGGTRVGGTGRSERDWQRDRRRERGRGRGGNGDVNAGKSTRTNARWERGRVRVRGRNGNENGSKDQRIDKK